MEGLPDMISRLQACLEAAFFRLQLIPEGSKTKEDSEMSQTSQRQLIKIFEVCSMG
jgi:hypothetical protein